MRLFAWVSVLGFSLSFVSIALGDGLPAGATTLLPSNGNNCSSTYYPPLAVRLNHEGAVTLAVHIDEKGNATGADISQSSGWPELDEASKQCVTAKWHFLPATQDGKPVASTKQYRIIWKLGAPNAAPRLLTPPEAVCSTIFVDAKTRWPTYRSTTLQFRVLTVGAVEVPFVAVSSGDALFDARTVQCMHNLKFLGAILGGTLTDISWTAAIRWSPHLGVAYTDAGNNAPYCVDSFFPSSIWKGDPPSPTVISFRIVPGGQTQAATIEQPSGNADLDAAALRCVGVWRLATTGASTGDLVRFNWHEGHAFILWNPPN